MTDQALEPLGYQLVEVMGHQRVVGWVEPRLFGGMALFHVTMTARDPVETRIDGDGIWVGDQWCGHGSLIREARPAIDQYLGVSSIFRMTAITEEQALALQPVRREVLECVAQPQLASGRREFDDDSIDDPDFEEEEEDFEERPA